MNPNIYVRIATLPYGGFILKQWQQLKNKIGGRVVIQGSYNTSNIGDLAIGITIKRELDKIGIKSHLNGFINDYRLRTPNFRRYDYHIIGGGGVMRDYPPNYLETRLKSIGTSRKGSIALGVGFDGLRTKKGKQQIRKLNECKAITVRDKKSQEYLQYYLDKEVEVAACPAFLTEPVKPLIGINENTIGINLRDLYGDDKWGSYLYFPDRINLEERRKWYIGYINNTLKPYLKDIAKERNLVFIPFTKSDILFAKNYLGDLQIKILPLQPPDKTLGTIQALDKMICMRYHSIIFSIVAEKPLFVISYHNKTRELAKKLAGLTYIDLFSPESIEVDFTVSSEYLSRIKNRMINSAKKNFQILKNLISTS